MQAFKKARKNAKAAITRTQTWITENKDSETDPFLFQTKLNSLRTEISKYSDAQNEIEDLDVDNLDPEDRNSFENSCDKLVSILNKKIHTLNAPSPPASNLSSSNSHTSNDSRLGLFSALIKNNVSLTEVQKLIYLKSYLKGEPLSLIESLEITNENFETAIDILEKRYENNLAIINSHLNSILDCPTLNKCTAVSLREFVVNIQRNLESLKNLKCPTQHWDLIIINIILKKLDYGTKKEYQSNRDLKSDPTLKELFGIIVARCNALESLSPSSASVVSDTKTENFRSKLNHKTTLHVNNVPPTSPVTKGRTCWYCKTNDHDIYKCYKFTKISTDEKYQFLRAQSLCFNCMGAKHLMTECRSKGCNLCGKNHHTLLHKNPNQVPISRNYSEENLQLSNYIPRTLSKTNNSPRVNSNSQNSYDQNFQGSSNSPRAFSKPQKSTGAIPKAVQNNSMGHNMNSNQNWKFPPRLSPTPNANDESHFQHSEPEARGNLTAPGMPSSLFVGKENTEVVLATAVVDVLSHDGHWVKARVILDNGSQCSFASEKFVRKLNGKTYDNPLQFSGIKCTPAISNKMLDIVVSSNTHESFKFKVSCAVLPIITSRLPRIPLNKQCLNIPPHFTLADPDFHLPSDVHLLLGAEVYYEIILPQIHNLGPKLPTLQLTKLGWVIGGQLAPQNHSKQTKVALLCQDTSNPTDSPEFIDSLDKSLQKFWEVEELPEFKSLTTDEESAEQSFLQTHVRCEDGTFQVNFPFKSLAENAPLGDSFLIAKKRFCILEKRFQNNPELFSTYKEFIEEYVSLKHATYVPYPNSKSGEIKYFLPHHCVIKDSSETTKLRVVFDASSKTSTGVSLNDILHKGYQVQPDLYDILCRFRQHPFVLTCDIEKMYRQVKMNPSQLHLQNILWRNSPQEDLKCIQLSTVTYGITSSSFLATRVLKELASTSNEFSLAQRALLRQTYVDDVLQGADSFSELEDSYHQLNSLLNSAGFRLHKWSSNSSQFRQLYCESPDPIQYEIKMENSPNKVLGLSWNSFSDNFVICLPKFSHNDTPSKRRALSVIAQMFDPVGFLGPFIVLGKIFMQKLWLSKLSWDESLPNELSQEWKRFIDSIESLKLLEIPRCLFLSKSIVKIQVHGYADSSERAYGSCLYFRTIYSDNTIATNLVTSKSRVAPLKTISLPRLELCAMVLLSKLTQRILKIFDNCLTFESINLWTDSQIALHWIQSHPSRWHTFVAHRVSQIQTALPNAQWRHVQSSKNPADVLSRGVLAPDLLNFQLWWHGSDFLSDVNLDLSKFNLKPIPNVLPEQRSSKLQVLVANTDPKNDFWSQIFKRFSSFNKLLHAVAYVIRFVFNSRNRETRLTGPLSLVEINSALVLVLRNLQFQHFSKEISELKSLKIISDKSILALNPFLNEQGLICVGGRLRHADVPESQKHPVLLPSKSYVVSLLLKREHIRLGHAGAQTVLANVRLQYWPLNGIREVKGVIHKCMTCFRFRAVTAQQLMSDLPRDRVTPSRPFEKVGIDYGGPFLIKSSRLRKSQSTKCYMAVFVCMATKAIHLELVSALSTEAFLLALKRFLSRRGIPAVIYSDNATNFIGARNHLKELSKFLATSNVSEQLKLFSVENSINWKFIPPRSPHWGGLWEASVKGAKGHLYRILGNAHLTFEELSTVLCQIEAILNSRPLCPISSDPMDLTVLTPGHFLIGRSLTAYPERDITHLPENRITFWKRCSQLQQSFWKRWTTEYLNRLQNRPKWLSTSKNLQVEDLVLLRGEDIPPLKWPLARIVEVIPGLDKGVRAVKLLTKEGVFVRPITKVCPLPSTASDKL